MNIGDVSVITGSAFIEQHNENGYIADIESIKILKNGTLTSAIGIGTTKRKARQVLANNLQGETIVRGAYTPNRWEVVLPQKISATISK